jgi:hypothetical protein
MRELCKNLGVEPAQMAALLTGGAPTAQSPTGAPGGESPEVAALKAEIASLKSEIGTVGQTIQEQKTAAVRSSVEAFAAANPRFDELSNTIAELLQTGFAKDLPDAYAKAERLSPAAPAPAAGQTAQAAPASAPVDVAAQTRAKAALSITGSPASGSNPTTRKPAGSPREALAAAFAQVGGI